MPLTELQIRNAKAQEKRYLLTDGRGLHLEVMTSGQKYWRLRYYSNGKQSWHTLGIYPAIGLNEARERAVLAKQRVRDGLPLKEEKQGQGLFSELAYAWAEDHDKKLSNDRNKRQVRSRLETHILPFIGDTDISDIEPSHILTILKRLEENGRGETITRVRSMVSQIFRYAAANGKKVVDPTTVLRGAITVPPKENYASITDPAGVTILLRAIWAYPHEIVREAMKFSAYTFARPGEVRCAEWKDIDLDDAVWRLSEKQMKMRRAHIVPLSKQVIELLMKMKERTGHGRYVFPSARTKSGSRPMSDNTVNNTLRALGFDADTMTAHGFRSMASTLLNENGFRGDWVERQLAHVEKNTVRAAYNRAEYLQDRRDMIQWYADYLDSLREGTEKPDRPISV